MIKEQYVYIKDSTIVSHANVPIIIEHDQMQIVNVDISKSYIIQYQDGLVTVDYVDTLLD